MTCRASLLLATLVGVLVTGCSSGPDKPATLPPLTPTPTPSATAVPADVPSPARVHDAFGAAAFVRFYYAQLNRAWSLPNDQLLVPLSDPECGTCKTYREAATTLMTASQRIRGDSIRIISAEAPPEENGVIAVDVIFDQLQRDVVNKADDVLQALPPDTGIHETVFVRRVPSGWVVRAVKEVKK